MYFYIQKNSIFSLLNGNPYIFSMTTAMLLISFNITHIRIIYIA